MDITILSSQGVHQKKQNKKKKAKKPSCRGACGSVSVLSGFVSAVFALLDSPFTPTHRFEPEKSTL
jgi:hypothetical protein